MRAALYARYSTDLQRESSITDQLRVCERLAERHGFTVTARFSDQAMSGGTTQRPGYQQLLRAARLRGFDVIVAEDASRLWRNMAEQATRMAELRDIGIHLVTHDLDSRQESSAMLGAVLGAMGEGYRQEIARRTRRGLEGLARNRKSTGGKAFGYVSATTSSTDQREIDPVQAAVVMRIFQMYADGQSARSIADRLNADRVPSPGASWQRSQRRRAGWLASAIAGDPKRGIGILCNEMYVGRVTWNRSRWIRSASDSKRRRQVANPKAEWIVHADERLRIVPDELWRRVKARQTLRQHQVGDRVSAGLSAAAAGRTGRHGKFLFSGLLRCGECGASFVMADRAHYACASRTNGGKSCCGNDARFRRDDIQVELLAGIRRELATPTVVVEIGRKVRARLRQLATPDKAPTARITALSAEIDRLCDGIAQVGVSIGLADRLRATEAELAQLREAAIARPEMVAAELLLPDLEARYLRLLERLPQTLESVAVAKARAEMAERVGQVTVVTTPERIEFYSEKGRMEAAFLRAVGLDLPSANMNGSGGRI